MIGELNLEEILNHAQGLTGYNYEMVVAEDRVELNMNNTPKATSCLTFKLEQYDNSQVRVSSFEMYGDNTINPLTSEFVPRTTDDVTDKLEDLYKDWWKSAPSRT
jgi:hypothetical protein